MQTILESLEQSYLNLLNLKKEALRENTCLDTYCREEVCCSLSELTKAIVLLIVHENVFPTDARVYIDIIENNLTFSTTDDSTKQSFINMLYEHDILHREKTVGELIEELKKFAPSLKVTLEGNNKFFNKFAIDDTSTSCITLVGVEH